MTLTFTMSPGIQRKQGPVRSHHLPVFPPQPTPTSLHAPVHDFIVNGASAFQGC